MPLRSRIKRERDAQASPTSTGASRALPRSRSAAEKQTALPGRAPGTGGTRRLSPTTSRNRILQGPRTSPQADREPRRGNGAVMCVCRFYPRRSWDRLQHRGPGPHSLMTDGTNDGSQERPLSRLPSTPDLEADLALTSLLIDSLLLSHASRPMFQDSDLDNLCLPAFPHFLC